MENYLFILETNETNKGNSSRVKKWTKDGKKKGRSRSTRIRFSEELGENCGGINLAESWAADVSTQSVAGSEPRGAENHGLNRGIWRNWHWE